MNFRAKIWWFIRDMWHRPSMMRDRLWSFTFYWDGLPKHLPRWDFRHAIRVYKMCPRYLWYDIKNVVKWTFWRLMWIQPFRCNGNRGEWRTRFCNWLEDRARFEEGDQF